MIDDTLPEEQRDDDPECPPREHMVKPGQPDNPKPQKAAPMPPKWQQVIDLMVIGGLCFQDAMKSVGADATLHVLSRPGHGWSGTATAENIDLVCAFFDRYLKAD